MNPLRILLAAALALASACETETVRCVPDPGIDGLACACKLGPTPPACTDLGTCLMECPQ